jgi:hypothetical protein
MALTFQTKNELAWFIPDFDVDAAIELLRYKQTRIASAKKSHFNMQKSKILQPICVSQ